MDLNKLGFNTLAIHAGQFPDPATGSMAVPIYQTTSYAFKDSDHAARLFNLEEEGHIYTRMSNPTVSVFEERISALEGGVGALATSSGQAAITVAIMAIAGAGDEIVSSSNLYGGTFNLFDTTLRRLGITVKFVDPSNPENFRAAISPKTKAVYGEIIGNPKIDVLDLEPISAIAHENRIPFIVDNTFASPYLCKPFQHGVDIVIHSTTKFIGGHGTSIGGVIVDSGNFHWTAEKFRGLVEPDPSYHDISYTGTFGKKAYIVKCRAQLVRDLGCCLSPFNAFLLLQGLETLGLRMERHTQNAIKIAEFLANHTKVSWVNYPSLPGDPSHEIASKYFAKGTGAILTFGIKGGKPAGKTFIDSVKVFTHLANVGDARSLVIHPASTTHQQLNAEQQKESGVTDDMIRLSVGIEDVEDLIADLDQAIAKGYASV